MSIRGVDRLNVSGAVRYEDYPGIGDVATPKFGLIYAPNTTFEIKASWGTSFRAPSLRQEYQPKGVILFRPGTLGGSGFPAGSAVALVQGGNRSEERRVGKRCGRQGKSWGATDT